MNNNWPNDAKVGCKAPSNLLDLIVFELNIKYEFDEFEDSFEQNELKEDFYFYFFWSFYIFEICDHIFLLDNRFVIFFYFLMYEIMKKIFNDLNPKI